MAEHNFTGEPTATVNSPYPAGITPEIILANLHNHDMYIRATCPELVSYELTSGTAAGVDQTAHYSITDKKPIGKTTYPCVITNRADGIETKVNAKSPIGSMVIESKWVATPTELQERIWVDGNLLVKKAVKGLTEKNHAEAHKVLFKGGAPAAA